MNEDVFAVLVLLLPPLLGGVAILAGTSVRFRRPRVVRVLLVGVYVLFGILMQLLLAWRYFRPDFG